MSIFQKCAGAFRFLIALGFGILFQGITSRAPTPELATTLWFSLPAFAMFLLFTGSILSWGTFLKKISRIPEGSASESALLELTFGSVFFYLLGYVMTVCGLFDSSRPFFALVVVASGYGVQKIKTPLSKWFFSGRGNPAKFFSILLWAIVFTKLLEGLQFSQHGDAYVAYLPGARAWTNDGNFSRFLEYNQFFLSTSWESLFAWGNVLMGLKDGAGLDLSQWFSQWTICGISVAGVLLAALSLANRWTTQFSTGAKPWFSLVAIAAIQVPVLRWTANLAKNDFGIVFWGMASYFLVTYLAPLSGTLALISGIVLGAAVIGKVTLGVFGVVIGLALILRHPKRTVFFVIGGLIGIAPVLIRNWALTQNPLYPWFQNIFPSSISMGGSVLAGTMQATNFGIQSGQLGGYFRELADQLPWAGSIFVLMLFSKQRWNWLKISLVPILILVLFTITLRPPTEIRYQSATLALVAALGVFCAFTLLEEFKFKKITIPLLGIILLATSNLTLFTVFQIRNPNKFAAWPEREKKLIDLGGPGKVWIRSNLKATDRILVVGDGYPFYLLDYHTRQYSLEPGLEEAIAKDQPEMLLGKISSSSFQYVYFSSEADYTEYRSKIQKAMDLADHQWNIKCKIYDGIATDQAKSCVWDLACLKNPL